MSRQFHVTSIFALVGEATALDHQGNAFVNTDYPIGTVLVTDTVGDVFVARRDFLHWKDMELMLAEQSTLEISAEGTIPFFRDYWSFVISASEWKSTKILAPHFQAIRNARKKILWERANA